MRNGGEGGSVRKGFVAAALAVALAFGGGIFNAAPATAGMVEATELSTGRKFMMVAPNDCWPPNGQQYICLFANANDPNTAVWRLSSYNAYNAGVPKCVPVGNDQFGQSMNNRASYIIARLANNSSAYGWDVWDYTTCGQYETDWSSYVYPTSSGAMASSWDNIIGSVKINIYR